MSVITPEKIFLDTKDEITTATERIIKAREKQLIVIIPERSILFTSPISIGILYRKAVLAGKTIIIVTEDERGAKLSQRRNYIVVSKVSQISSELWEFAYDRVLKEKSKLDSKFHARDESFEVSDKILNVEEHQEEVVAAEVDYEEIEDFAELEEKGEIVESNHTESLNEEAELSTYENDFIDESKTNEEDKDEQRKRVHREELEKKAESFVRPKSTPKVVSAGGIQIVAGGDIATLGTMEGDTLETE